jgi:hypothetical protein
MEQRVNVITLGVADVRRSRDFYRALGWVETSGADGRSSFQAGELVVSLRERATLAAGITLGLAVESLIDVEMTLAEARGAGARIEQPASGNAWSGYSGVFVDLDGHAWEVCAPPTDAR